MDRETDRLRSFAEKCDRWQHELDTLDQAGFCWLSDQLHAWLQGAEILSPAHRRAIARRCRNKALAAAMHELGDRSDRSKFADVRLAIRAINRARTPCPNDRKSQFRSHLERANRWMPVPESDTQLAAITREARTDNEPATVQVFVDTVFNESEVA